MNGCIPLCSRLVQLPQVGLVSPAGVISATADLAGPRLKLLGRLTALGKLTLLGRLGTPPILNVLGVLNVWAD